MPCKHEGGTDPCVKTRKGECQAKCRKTQARYKKTNLEVPSGNASIYSGGKAAELLVEADLLLKGLTVTRPSNPDVPDDLHAKIGNKWLTFQIKMTRRNKRTGAVYLPKTSTVTSDILALVIGRTRKIEYRPWSIRTVPKVLR